MARLFVSDLHLDASAPGASEQFLDFLRTHAAHAEALYILGDMFESWVGDDEPDPQKTRICAGVRALTASGVACFVLHGNRDFLLGRSFCDRTGVRLLPDPVVADLYGERVLVTHGDALCTDDHSYQELRSTVRAVDWQEKFLGLPLAVREKFANRAREGSKAHTTRTAPVIMDVNQNAVIKAFRATQTRRMIHGHTHRPARHEYTVDGEKAERIVLGAWYEQGSYLWCDSGRFELRELKR